MTTDTTALQERIARAIHLDDLQAGEAEPWGADEYLTAWYRRNASAVLPIVAVEVRKAKAEALREAAGSIDLNKIADEWSQGPGNRDDMHWAAGNAASSVVATLHDRAAEVRKAQGEAWEECAAMAAHHGDFDGSRARWLSSINPYSITEKENA